MCCQTATRMAIFGWYPARFSSLTTCSIAVHALGSGSVSEMKLDGKCFIAVRMETPPHVTPIIFGASTCACTLEALARCAFLWRTWPIWLWVLVA